MITVMDITQEKIAKKFGKNQRFISDLKCGERYTTDHKLAIAVAKRYGKLPIEYINPNKRDMYLKAYPQLGRPVKSAHKSVKK
jgi:transcriptional regulator with XRE-family HTH domain